MCKEIAFGFGQPNFPGVFSFYRTVGVLSAMYGVTNKLIEAGKSALLNDRMKVAKIRADLLNLHTRTLSELIPDPTRRDEPNSYIHDTFKVYFDRVCEEIERNKFFSDESNDAISSVGERWSNKIMASYLLSQNQEALFIEADTLIITDEVSGNAKPILDVSKDRIQKILVPVINQGVIPFVPGFYGSSIDTGKLTTLGRGGSDLTAAVLGYSLDAKDVSLWKVEFTTQSDGWMQDWKIGWEGVVHDADPSWTISSLAYEEAAELAHFGKKVLHPDTVRPAVEKAIPISVRNTLNPVHPGTRIESYCMTSANYKPRVHSITKMPLSVYEAKNSRVLELDMSALHIQKEEAVIVALVGLHIMKVEDLEEKVLKVMHESSIPAFIPKIVNGSPNNFSIIVPSSKREETVKALHKAFIALNN
jgi:bifunctional aspartokinase / homoserine dehydrogenase 1